MLIADLRDKKYFLTYFRDEKKNPIGVALAYLRNDGTLRYGWSMVGKFKDNSLKDSFNKTRGQMIAFKRAENVGFFKNVPPVMEDFLKHFQKESKEFTSKLGPEVKTVDETIIVKTLSRP